MPYDPKKQPNYLGFEKDRTNPNRLNTGVLSVADQNENNIVPIEQPQSTGAKILAVLKVVAVVLAAACGSLVAAAAGGAAIPAWLLSICTAVIAIAAPLGLVSPGMKALQKKE